MRQVFETLKDNHKTLRQARLVGKIADSGFVFKDVFISVCSEIVEFLISIVLIKHVLDSLQEDASFSELVPVLLAIAFISLVNICMKTYQDNSLRTNHILLLGKEVSKKIYNKLIKLPYKEQFNQETKNISQFAFSSGAIAYYNADVIPGLYIGYSVAFIINSISVFVYGGWIGGGILGIFLILTLVMQKLENSIAEKEFAHSIFENNEGRKTYYYRNGVFLNKQSNLMLKIYDAERFFLSKYKGTVDNVTQDKIRTNKEIFIKKVLSRRAFTMAFFTVYFLIFSYRFVVLREITIGTLWAVYTACLAVFSNNLFGYISTSQQAVRYIGQMELLFSLEEEKEKGIQLNLNDDFCIEFEHVYFAYPGSQRNVLKDLSLKIKKGERVVLLGENGAGKTTIILLLYRLLKPTSGRILLNGVDIDEYSLDEYRSVINIMFQDFKLYPYPLASNISLKNDYFRCKDEILDVIERVGLTKTINELSNGIDTNLTRLFDENGFVPSGGQASKIGFAQQMMRTGELFVYDEYDSNIDPISEMELNNQLLEVKKTNIIISHRLSIAREADRIYWINRGNVLESGTHDELCKKNGKYATLLKQQSML